MKVSFSATIDGSVLDKAKCMAVYEGRPLSNYIEIALKEYLAGEITFKTPSDVIEINEDLLIKKRQNVTIHIEKEIKDEIDRRAKLDYRSTSSLVNLIVRIKVENIELKRKK